MPISTMLPSAQPIRFAGGLYDARELRLCDLASLEAWAARQMPGPLDDLDPAAADYAARLAHLYDNIKIWPPPFGSEECDRYLFNSPQGRTLILQRVLRSHRPRLSVEDLDRLSSNATPEEWGDLLDLAYGTGAQADPWLEVVRRIDRYQGIEPFKEIGGIEDEDAEPHEFAGDTWPVAIANACKALKATPAEVGRLTLTQWRTLTGDGKAKHRGDPLPADDAIMDMVQDKRAAFWEPFLSAQEAAERAKQAEALAGYYADRPDEFAMHPYPSEELKTAVAAILREREQAEGGA